MLLVCSQSGSCIFDYPFAFAAFLPFFELSMILRAILPGILASAIIIALSEVTYKKVPVGVMLSSITMLSGVSPLSFVYINYFIIIGDWF